MCSREFQFLTFGLATSNLCYNKSCELPIMTLVSIHHKKTRYTTTEVLLCHLEAMIGLL